MFDFYVSAQHVVSGKDDIQQAMEFLKECDLIRIEDILPFFSDFVTIDHFREAICNSLQVRFHKCLQLIFNDSNVGIQPKDTRSQRRNGRSHPKRGISTRGNTIIQKSLHFHFQQRLLRYLQFNLNGSLFLHVSL